LKDFKKWLKEKCGKNVDVLNLYEKYGFRTIKKKELYIED